MECEEMAEACGVHRFENGQCRRAGEVRWVGRLGGGGGVATGDASFGLLLRGWVQKGKGARLAEARVTYARGGVRASEGNGDGGGEGA
jgi:hypothetical protein